MLLEAAPPTRPPTRPPGVLSGARWPGGARKAAAHAARVHLSQPPRPSWGRRSQHWHTWGSLMRQGPLYCSDADLTTHLTTHHLHAPTGHHGGCHLQRHEPPQHRAGGGRSDRTQLLRPGSVSISTACASQRRSLLPPRAIHTRSPSLPPSPPRPTPTPSSRPPPHKCPSASSEQRPLPAPARRCLPPKY